MGDLRFKTGSVKSLSGRDLMESTELARLRRLTAEADPASDEINRRRPCVGLCAREGLTCHD
jgi:hypothetical protein